MPGSVPNDMPGTSGPRFRGDDRSRSRWRARLLLIFGTYYVATGIWPLVHMASFEVITGHKVDDWLVHMVGLLAAVIGLTMIVAARRGSEHDPAVTTMVVGAAIAFTAIDVWYVATSRISTIYLFDAALEIILIAGVFLTRVSTRTNQE